MAYQVFVVGKNRGDYEMNGRKFHTEKLHVITEMRGAGVRTDEYAGLCVEKVNVTSDVWNSVQPGTVYDLYRGYGNAFEHAIAVDFEKITQPLRAFVSNIAL